MAKHAIAKADAIVMKSNLKQKRIGTKSTKPSNAAPRYLSVLTNFEQFSMAKNDEEEQQEQEEEEAQEEEQEEEEQEENSKERDGDDDDSDKYVSGVKEDPDQVEEDMYKRFVSGLPQDRVDSLNASAGSARSNRGRGGTD